MPEGRREPDPSQRGTARNRTHSWKGAAGLCDSCRHQRVVRNTRGSRFSLCERSRTDPEYPRYPSIPVRNCDGYESSHPSK